jgi:ribonuclease P protein component
LRSVTSLRGRKAFEAVRTAGRATKGEYLRFFYDFDVGRIGLVRIGVIVGKRHGSAVCRNLVKRRIREACKLLTGLNLGEAQRKLSVVIVYGGSKRQPATRVSFDEIKGDVIEFVRVIRTLSANK